MYVDDLLQFFNLCPFHKKLDYIVPILKVGKADLLGYLSTAILADLTLEMAYLAVDETEKISPSDLPALAVLDQFEFSPVCESDAGKDFLSIIFIKYKCLSDLLCANGLKDLGEFCQKRADKLLKKCFKDANLKEKRKSIESDYALKYGKAINSKKVGPSFWQLLKDFYYLPFKAHGISYDHYDSKSSSLEKDKLPTYTPIASSFKEQEKPIASNPDRLKIIAKVKQSFQYDM